MSSAVLVLIAPLLAWAPSTAHRPWAPSTAHRRPPARARRCPAPRQLEPPLPGDDDFEFSFDLREPLPNPKKQSKKRAGRPPRPDKVAKRRIGCYGCGADLQTERPDAAGYCEPERYELKASRRQLRLLLCCRCRNMAQGEILPAVVEGRLRRAGSAGVTTPEELRAELAPLREQKMFTVLLVDLLDVTGSFLPRLRDMVGGNPIVLVGTKADLLPRGTEPKHVEAWLASQLSPRLNVLSVHLVSARTGEGMARACRSVMLERRGRNVFVVGAANVGKSSFIGSFIEEAAGGRVRRLPLSSATPGTTLRIIGIDCFGGGSMLFDTPGLHLQHRMQTQLLPEELKAIMPRGKLKPYTPAPAEAAEGFSYLWGGLARIDVVQAPPSLRLSFCAFNLTVSSCADTADAAARYAEEVGVGLTPPLSRASADELGGLVMKKRVELQLSPVSVAADVCVSGLGWVAVSALASLRATTPEALRTVLDVWVPKGVGVGVRNPMPIGGLPVDVDVAHLLPPAPR